MSSRVFLMTALQCVYRLMLMFGWTFLTALFVSREGAVNLPLLFLLNAVLIMTGSLLVTLLLKKYSEKQLFVFSILISFVLVLAARYFFDFSLRVSFALMLLTVAFFLVQVQVFLASFQEHLFTPREGERDFPHIEVGETLGVLFSGLLLYGLVGFLSIKGFFTLWMLSIVFMFPFIFLLFRQFKKASIPHLVPKKASGFQGHKEAFKFFEKSRFAVVMFFVVLLYWVVSNLLEFQFINAVAVHAAKLPNSGSGLEHALIHELGGLQILFAVGILLMQFALSRKLLHKLGMVPSMTLYPLLLLFSLFPAIISFGFFPAVLMRFNGYLTSIPFKNAYHETFFAFPPRVRDYIREFFEGFARPIGAIAGTSLLLVLTALFHDQYLPLALNVVLFAGSLILLITLLLLQGSYTTQATHALFQREDPEYQLEAVEILSQNGHRKGREFLLSALEQSQGDPVLKTKILSTLRESDDSLPKIDYN